MATFASFDGTPIAYETFGAGPPVLLLHGFAANRRTNWEAPGVVAALVAAGRHVIAADARGHGESGKPHEPDAYANDAMVRDARALLDHLGHASVDVVGYSMGAMTAVRLVAGERRARSVVLGGVGGDATPPRAGGADSPLAAALENEDGKAVKDPVLRGFRMFAARTGADRRALAAIERGRSLRSPVRFDAITMPALVLAGEKDSLIRPPHELAARLPRARLALVPGDHLSAVAQPAFRAAIVAFLAAVDRGEAPEAG
jgi:pimeloyl-ACP methyl ester carboxylesterase